MVVWTVIGPCRRSPIITAVADCRVVVIRSAQPGVTGVLRSPWGVVTVNLVARSVRIVVTLVVTVNVTVNLALCRGVTVEM